MSDKTGGAAFPRTYAAGWEAQDGMTLRDYLAAKAMQGILSSGSDAKSETIAVESYAVADAMLAERERP